MGWVRSHATLGYFGIDPRMLGYTTQDYVLRSLNSTFAPLIIGTLAGLSLVKLHEVLVEPRISRSSGTWTVRVLRIGLLVGAALAALVCARLASPTMFVVPRGLMLPAALVLSLGLLTYCPYLLSRVRPGPTASTDEYRRFRALAILGLGFIAVLWLLAVYAQETGVARAEDIAGRLRRDPAVTVYSEFPLAVNGLGIRMARFGADDHKYRYVYTGLRLLESGDGTIVLVSPSWRKGEKIYVLDDNESIRVDFRAIR